VWLDVIGELRGNNFAFSQAHGAEWLASSLHARLPAPVCASYTNDRAGRVALSPQLTSIDADRGALPRPICEHEVIDIGIAADAQTEHEIAIAVAHFCPAYLTAVL
jgi:hypothetical protein